MIDRSPFATRLAAAIAAYAEAAPVDVDPLATARLAAAGSRRFGPFWAGPIPGGTHLAFLLLMAALLVSLGGGALVAGGRPSNDVERIERAFVEPFLGLPPEGTPPSGPETGELVVSFDGRVLALGGDFFRMWLYADGRLLWKSNLEGSGRTNPAFGATPATPAVIEQHLTPEGVVLMRSEVLRTASILGPTEVGRYATRIARPGTGVYSTMTIGEGERLFDATWTDHRLPGRLADPGSWLPASAWADRRLGGFVAARYAVCVPSDAQTIDRLPERSRSLIRTNGTPTPGSGVPPGDCVAVELAAVREIAASLDASGFTLEWADHALQYSSADKRGAPDRLRILPIVPHGEAVCSCG